MTLFVNRWFLILTCLIIEVLAVLPGITRENWSWFGRSGSVIALAGGLLAARKVFRQGVEALYLGETTIDGGDFKTNADFEMELLQIKEDIICAKIGGGLIILGTLIWGYGDLLGHYIKF